MKAKIEYKPDLKKYWIIIHNDVCTEIIEVDAIEGIISIDSCD